MANWLNKLREKFDNYEIPLGTSVRELYKAIKSKKAIGIVGDQRGKRDGIIVNFFGRKTATFPGTAAIALKLRCPVMVLLCARKKDGQYVGMVQELNFDDLQDSSEPNVIEFNQRYMNILEEAIRKYPEQWFWMHNIWKY